MTSYVDLKKSITLSSTELVTKLCQPFFQATGIIFFDFLRVYKNQGHICLTTDGEWNRLYYEKGFFEGRRLEYYNKNDISGCAVEALEINTARDLERISAQIPFNRAHHFHMTNTYKDYKDTFTFGSCLGNSRINSYYLSHINILRDFTNYFLFSILPILKEAEKEKFYFPKGSETNIKLFEDDPIYNTVFPLGKFYDSIQLKKYPIEVNNKFVYLSQREIEVLRKFIQGKSAKAIAKNLDITYRTVEAHIYKIRQKLECCTQGELIEKIFSNNVIKEYLLNGHRHINELRL